MHLDDGQKEWMGPEGPEEAQDLGMRITRKAGGPGRGAHGYQASDERGSRKRTRRGQPRRWVNTVTSVSTKTPPGVFTRDAAAIARTLALPRVSPKGAGLGLANAVPLHQSRRPSALAVPPGLMRRMIEAERARP